LVNYTIGDNNFKRKSEVFKRNFQPVFKNKKTAFLKAALFDIQFLKSSQKIFVGARFKTRPRVRISR
jgi:hypothetical protein